MTTATKSAAVTDADRFAQLDELGYTVFPAFMDRTMTAEIRAHTDSLLPPILPPDQLGDQGPVRVLRHPIPGAIMARILDRPELLDLAKRLLRADKLYLLEQVLIRTDPKPAPHGPGGWHIDFAFVPEEYDATPRQTYFHMVQACNTVRPGAGAFMIVPGSHKLTYAATAKLGVANLVANEGTQGALKTDPIKAANIDVSKAIEVRANDGDLLVFNPMALHSASGNATLEPRYVYFASFMDAGNRRLKQHLLDNKYLKGFPDSLRDNLSPEARAMLDWVPRETQPSA